MNDTGHEDNFCNGSLQFRCFRGIVQIPLLHIVQVTSRESVFLGEFPS